MCDDPADVRGEDQHGHRPESHQTVNDLATYRPDPDRGLPDTRDRTAFTGDQVTNLLVAPIIYRAISCAPWERGTGRGKQIK
ncbi:hypothetical protein [Streptomyces mirabilis]|uniref:hypothetical protein n=1 Tax=Streptomyces mirabilis TaxID=68239 RepID=UPI003689A144